VCSRLVAGVSGSNSVEGMDVRVFLCCVCSGLCDELITYSEGCCLLGIGVYVCV
jgi:hypothetical protein